MAATTMPRAKSKPRVTIGQILVNVVLALVVLVWLIPVMIYNLRGFSGREAFK